jgi:DNA-binding response OmpR family regulator
MARERGAPGSQQLASGDLVVDLDRRDVLRRGESLHLKPKEYELLVFPAGKGQPS